MSAIRLIRIALNSLFGKSMLLLLIMELMSCDSEKTSIGNPEDLLLGRWNSYEQGTEQAGFAPIITKLLTILYDSGLAFSNDGTFKTRYYSDDTWTESETVIGSFEFKGKTISLTFFPLTDDEYKLDLQLVKLDKTHLWFKHSLWGEKEYHLERSN
jgi:hypothetical protein